MLLKHETVKDFWSETENETKVEIFQSKAKKKEVRGNSRVTLY